MTRRLAVAAGAGGVLAARALLARLLLVWFRRLVRQLNEGDYRPLLDYYSDAAVLRFNEGPHRWSGEHRGRAAVEGFLREFTAAQIKGEVRRLWFSGPPWALVVAVRFDDHAAGPDGEQIYSNSTVIVLRTRWGKIVEQDDFYLDTGRIAEFEQRLKRLGIEPAPR
jgi:ketosteroid isomerase-like protein